MMTMFPRQDTVRQRVAIAAGDCSVIDCPTRNTLQAEMAVKGSGDIIGMMATPPLSSSSRKRPPSRLSPLKVQWPPQRSQSQHVESLTSAAATSLKDLSLMGEDVKYLFDISESIMTPSKVRAKMDCPVNPGVVEQRLSQLELAQSPSKSKHISHMNAEEENGEESCLQPQHQGYVTPMGSPLLMSPEKVSSKLPDGSDLKKRQQPSSKLHCRWPPISDTQKNQQLVDQRKHKTSREIQRAISGRSSGTIQETRSFYEKNSSCSQCQNSTQDDNSTCNTEPTAGSLSPTRSPYGRLQREHNAESSPRPQLPPRMIESLGTESGEGQLSSAKMQGPASSSTTSFIFTEDSVHIAFSEIVLPSGQRLPPPKGRKKNRRTNYRIRYQGPTLLRLEDVYGHLMEIPEVDNRFSAGLSDEGPLTKPMRRGRDVGFPSKPARRSINAGGRDVAPSCPIRQPPDDDDKSIEDALYFNDNDDDDHSMSDEELFGGNRPDVWIAPLKSFDGSRKWKVKRVWDVEEVDDEEPEYEVDHSDLISSIRDLLGVPDDLGATPQKWPVDFEEINPCATATEKDSPPSPARKADFTVETVYDFEGQHDGAEPSQEMTEPDLFSKIGIIADTTNHDLAVDEVECDCSRPHQLAHDRKRSSVRQSWRAKSIKKFNNEEHATTSDDSNMLVASTRKPRNMPLSRLEKKKSNKVTMTSVTAVEGIEQQREKVGSDGEKAEAGRKIKRSSKKPTWEKQATGSSKKEKDNIKMWWHT